MGFFSILKDAVRMNDLFYATEMLRYDKELEYRSFTGGLLSIAIIIAVIIGFASMILDTLSLSTITFVTTITKDTNPSFTRMDIGGGSKFMMAVQLWGVNMTDTVRYFDVLMIQLNTTKGQSDYNYSLIPFQRCTKQHWADFPEIASQYDDLSMQNWLCPQIGSSMFLSGDYATDIFRYVNVSINPCMDFLDPTRPCASASEVKTVFNHLSDAIRYKIYFTNPLINPGQKVYKSYYLESTKYISFGSTIGGQSYLYVADYAITTDNSIWPYPFIEDDNGLLIEDKSEFHPYTTFQSTYASFYFVKSPTTYTYAREVQKISTVFSFIGGLISAVSAALFILKIYNNLAFEVSLAICIFRPPDQDKDIDVANLGMNLFTFCKFHLYNFLKKIGKRPNWPDTAFIIDCREEIVRQLDIKSLVKRIIFAEYCLANLFEDYQLEGLQIQRPKTPADIRSIRQKCQSLDTYNECHFGETQKQSESSQNQSNMVMDNKHQIDFKTFNDLTSPASLNPDMVRPEMKIKSLKNKVLNSSLISDDKVMRPLQFDERIVKVDDANSSIDPGSIRMSRNLLILKQNAEEGNPLSKKIWNQLENNTQHPSRFKHRMGTRI